METKFTERTLVILKPDAVQRVLVGEVIKRFESIGLKIVALKMVRADKGLVEKHYTVDPNWVENTGARIIESFKKNGVSIDSLEPKTEGGKVLSRLMNYMSAGPVIPMVLEGAHSIALVRKLVGTTEPLSSDVGTIRGDYVIDSYALADSDNRSVRNIIHASGNSEEAKKEISLWFNDAELLIYETVHEKILYSKNFENES